MRKHWKHGAALALGLTVLGVGAFSASANNVTGATPYHASRLSGIMASTTDLIESVTGGGVVAPGTIDDGKDLLPQATITLDQAIAAAQATGNGALGEVDLEYFNGQLVFNIDIGSTDVKIDAADGAVLAVNSDD